MKFLYTALSWNELKVFYIIIIPPSCTPVHTNTFSTPQ